MALNSIEDIDAAIAELDELQEDFDETEIEALREHCMEMKTRLLSKKGRIEPLLVFGAVN